MKILDIAKILNAKIITRGNEPDLEVTTACGADLMSDVMAFARDNEILLTGLVNPQVIRTAEMMDIKAIVFVRGKIPGEISIKLAKDNGLYLLATEHPMFVACGKLYSNGLSGGEVEHE